MARVSGSSWLLRVLTYETVKGYQPRTCLKDRLPPTEIARYLSLLRKKVGMNLYGVVTAFLISQSSWILIGTVATFPALSEPFVMLGAGAVFIPAFAMLFLKLLPSTYKDDQGMTHHRNFFYYMCCLFSWSCTIDLILVFEATGVIQGFMDFYLRDGEPYLGSPFGVAVNLWDAVVHYLLYLIIVYKYDNNQNFRSYGLYWFGSMATGMFSLLIGSVSGSYGTHICPAVFLNIPYTILPFCAFVFLLRIGNDGTTKKTNSKYARLKQLRFMDFLLFVGLGCSILFGLLRGLAATGSPLGFVQAYLDYEPYILEPGKFGTMHCLFNFVYGVPLQVLSIYGLYKGDTTWLRDLSLVYAGGMAQGTYLQLASAMSPQTGTEYGMGQSPAWNVGLNLMLPIVAHLLLYQSTSRTKATNKKIR